jgi:serine/threonine protein kinase, bacterial
MSKHNIKHGLYIALPLALAALAGCGSSGTLSSDQSVGASAFQSTARFKYPYGIAVDSTGNLFVADAGNSEMREITPAGHVTTLDGVSAGLSQDVAVAVDKNDNLYVANAEEILLIAPDRTVTTLAGSDNPGSNNGNGGNAGFSSPGGVAVDGSGNLYVADTDNNEIRKITPSGDVSSFAGSTKAGSADGTGSSASFNQPFGIAIDSNDNLYVSDYGNNEIRKITPAGVVTTLAGSTKGGSANGAGNSASFNLPAGIAVDSNDNLYVADRGNNEIRKITSAGVVSTLAGSTKSGSADGTGASASFNSPFGVAVDKNGNVYVADTVNNEIREVSPAGDVVTIAGSTTAGNKDGTALPR